MRVPYLSLIAIFGIYVVATAPGVTTARAPAIVHTLVDMATEPDPALTPGAVATEDATKICAPGYARSARRTNRALKLAIYAAYKIAPDTQHYEIDHLIPLALGGADVAENLWPESEDRSASTVRKKDRLETFLRREVCAGRIPLRLAQAEIARDWHAAYRKYFPN